MMNEDIGPLPKIVRWDRPDARKLQVTFRIEPGANELALSEFFERVAVVPSGTRLVRRDGTDVTYCYDFDNKIFARTAEEMLRTVDALTQRQKLP